jgi:hypothetical protein
LQSLRMEIIPACPALPRVHDRYAANALSHLQTFPTEFVDQQNQGITTHSYNLSQP